MKFQQLVAHLTARICFVKRDMNQNIRRIQVMYLCVLFLPYLYVSLFFFLLNFFLQIHRHYVGNAARTTLFFLLATFRPVHISKPRQNNIIFISILFSPNKILRVIISCIVCTVLYIIVLIKGFNTHTMQNATAEESIQNNKQ